MFSVYPSDPPAPGTALKGLQVGAQVAADVGWHPERCPPQRLARTRDLRFRVNLVLISALEATAPSGGSGEAVARRLGKADPARRGD